jgi:hypothetical protein
VNVFFENQDTFKSLDDLGLSDLQKEQIREFEKEDQEDDQVSKAAYLNIFED